MDPTAPHPLPDGLSRATRAVVAGRPARVPDAPLGPPVTFASTYVAGGEVEYGRYGNPTWTAFEETLGDLEGGRALAFSSGLAAVSAVLGLLPESAVVAAPSNAYTGTWSQLEQRAAQGRAKLRAIDVADPASVASGAQGADLVWLESPTNPLLDVADVASAARAAHASDALLVVDNTFATPILRQPLDEGADVVVHSVTKLIAGHSDVQLGAVVVRDEALLVRLDDHRRLHGAIPGPMETWLALRGMRTLALRVDRAQASAAELANRLRSHPAIATVRHPGWGTMVSVELAGGREAADAFCDGVRLWIHATSLGGVESTLERRRRWPSESPQVSEGLVRMSVGIEDVDDLWADLVAALP